MISRLYLLCVLVLWSCAAFSAERAIIHTDLHSATVKPIYGYRAFRIEDQQLEMAKTLLAGKPAKLLSQTEFSALIPSRTYSGDDIIDLEVDLSDRYATERENEMKEPFFQKNKDTLKMLTEEALLHRQHIEYLKKIKNNVRPYLIEVEVCSPTKSFGGVLNIETGNIGLSEICYVPKKVPVWKTEAVVFSEVEIKTVESTAYVYPPWVKNTAKKHDSEGFEVD